MSQVLNVSELPLIAEKDFESLAISLIHEKTILIDVRAPVEFTAGAIPFSINAAILSDEERALVGTTYKIKGPAAAIEQGHTLVSGDTKKYRVEHWKNLIQTKPSAVITCFRGGLRSQISQTWLNEVGFRVPRIQGGYKAFRHFLRMQIENLPQQKSFQVISGPTGSGKTRLLREIQNQTPMLDLELAALHRGSAFGALGPSQPNQVNFENQLAFQIINLKNKFAQYKNILVEDESRLIGKCVLPDSLFNHLRESPVIMLNESLEQRVINTYDEYILQTVLSHPDEKNIEQALAVFDNFISSLTRISKKLGGLRFQEIKNDLEYSRQQFLSNRSLESNKVWIHKLLEWYYDPGYGLSLSKRQPIIEFQGNTKEVLSYIASKNQTL